MSLPHISNLVQSDSIAPSRHRKVMPNRNWLYFELLGGNGGTGGEGTAYVVDDGDHTESEEKKEKKEHSHRLHSKKRDEGVLNFARNYYAFDTKKGCVSILARVSGLH